MSKQGRPRFSVVIPCYNEARYIADTLSSLNQQTFDGNFEVIVVDNNCTDDSVAIAKRYGAHVIKELHPGVCWARDTGTRAAEGEIIVSTDADTVFDKDWLKNIDRSFQKNSRLVAVGGPCHYIGGPLWGRSYPYLLFGFIRTIYVLSGRTYYLTATNIAFKKSAWHGYNTGLTQGGDELDLLRNLRHEGKVRFDNGNPIFTSARRLTRGFVYNVIISFFIYYILEYNLNRIFKRRFFGSAPVFRDELKPRYQFITIPKAITSGLLIILVAASSRSLYYAYRLSYNIIDNINDTVLRK